MGDVKETKGGELHYAGGSGQPIVPTPPTLRTCPIVPPIKPHCSRPVINYPKMKPPYVIQIDPTFTKSGFAADAKLTGDYLRQALLQGALFDAKYDETPFLEILDASENGRIIYCQYDHKIFWLSDIDLDSAVFTTTYSDGSDFYAQAILTTIENEWSTSESVKLANSVDIEELYNYYLELQQYIESIEINLQNNYYTKSQVDSQIENIVVNIVGYGGW